MKEYQIHGLDLKVKSLPMIPRERVNRVQKTTHSLQINELQSSQLPLYTPRRTKYAEGVYSFRPFRSSVRPSVIPSVNPFYNQVLLPSFLLTYNSAATDKKLSIFGMGVPGKIIFHFTSMEPWVLP